MAKLITVLIEKRMSDQIQRAALALHQRPGVPGIRSTFGTMTELLNSLRHTGPGARLPGEPDRAVYLKRDSGNAWLDFFP